MFVEHGLFARELCSHIPRLYDKLAQAIELSCSNIVDDTASGQAERMSRVCSNFVVQIVSVTNGANGWANLRHVSSTTPACPALPNLAGLEIPVGDIVPDAVVDVANSVSIANIVKQLPYPSCSSRELTYHPMISGGNRMRRTIRQITGRAFDIT